MWEKVGEDVGVLSNNILQLGMKNALAQVDGVWSREIGRRRRSLDQYS